MSYIDLHCAGVRDPDYVEDSQELLTPNPSLQQKTNTKKRRRKKTKEASTSEPHPKTIRRSPKNKEKRVKEKVGVGRRMIDTSKDSEFQTYDEAAQQASQGDGSVRLNMGDGGPDEALGTSKEKVSGVRGGTQEDVGVKSQAHEHRRTKKRGKKNPSVVWKHFTKKLDGGSATCDHCGIAICCGPNIGTNTMLKHIKLYCKKYKYKDEGMVIKSPSASYVFNHEKSMEDFTVAVVKHHYPLNMVRHKYFVRFMKGVNPHLKLPCPATLRKNILTLFEGVKIEMHDIFDGLISRVTLTTDMWKSSHSKKNYFCVTIHFIDVTWTLRKKILAFKRFRTPHTGQALYEVLRGVIKDWNLGNKLGAIVVDNASNNDVMVEKLRNWFLYDLSLEGSMFHTRCSAHILNLVVHDGLEVIEGLLDNIRDTVRLIDRSDHCAQCFERAKLECKLNGLKEVPMDVQNRWNSTYLMLEAALPLRAAFKWWADFDSSYSHNPSEDEWEIAKVIYDCLKPFYQATVRLSGNQYPTSNLFFVDISDIHVKILQWEKSKYIYLRRMAEKMKKKFLKYWEEGSLGLTIATVLDPRFKMQTIEFYFNEIYGGDKEPYIKRVRDVLESLFVSYGGSIRPVPTTSVGSSTSMGDVPSSLYALERWCQASSVVEKSDLDLYLGESKFNSTHPLDVLQWWKQNQERLPILSKMAKDILAVPATTVASESAFSTSGRVISESRSRLKPDVVEAIMISGDWIPYHPDDTSRVGVGEFLEAFDSNELIDLEENFEEFDELDSDEEMDNESIHSW